MYFIRFNNFKEINEYINYFEIFKENIIRLRKFIIDKKYKI